MGVAYTSEWVGLIAMETNYPHTWAIFGNIMSGQGIATEDGPVLADSSSGGSVTGGIEDEDQGNDV